MPSRWSIAPEREAGEAEADIGEEASRRVHRAIRAASSDRHEVVVVQQHVDQVFAGALGRVGRGRRDRAGPGGNGVSFSGFA